MVHVMIYLSLRLFSSTLYRACLFGLCCCPSRLEHITVPVLSSIWSLLFSMTKKRIPCFHPTMHRMCCSSRFHCARGAMDKPHLPPRGSAREPHTSAYHGVSTTDVAGVQVAPSVVETVGRI